jgi:uncharacterized protein (TIRG00374 family)
MLMRKATKKIWIIGAVVFGTAALLFLLFSAGLNSVWTVLIQAKTEYLLLALAMTLLGLVVRGVRRVVFLRKVECQISTRRMFLILLSGCFFENVSPARLGEFFVPAALSVKDKALGSSTLSSVIVERTLDLGTASAIAILGILSLNLDMRLQSILIVGIAVTLVLMVMILRLTSIVGTVVHQMTNRFKFFRKVIAKDAETGFQNFMQNSKTSVGFLIKSKKTAILGLGLTLLLWSLNGLRLFFVVESVGLEVSLLQATVVVVFTILLAIASMVPFGYGTAELAMVFILTSLGTEFIQSKALGIALIDRFLAVWLIVLIGAIASLRLGKLGYQKSTTGNEARIEMHDC